MTTKDCVSFPVECIGNPELIFHVAGAEDAEELTEFIMINFFHQFPLKNAPGFDIEKEIRPWIGQYIDSMCSKSYSIILRDTSNGNRIAAAAINDLSDKNSPPENIDLYSFSNPVERPCWEKVCQLLDGLHIGIDLGEEPKLSMDLVAVGTEYYNRGLSTKCVKVTVQLAENKGIHAVKMEAVNEYMAIASVKVGFQIVSEIDLNRWEYNGEKPFATESVHQTARLLIYKIKN